MTRGRGWTVNDPQNPGRYYLQGRGLSVALAAAGASPIGQGIRAANDRRAEEQVALMSRLVAGAGDLVDGGRRTELAGHGRDLIAAALA